MTRVFTHYVTGTSARRAHLTEGLHTNGLGTSGYPTPCGLHVLVDEAHTIPIGTDPALPLCQNCAAHKDAGLFNVPDGWEVDVEVMGGYRPRGGNWWEVSGGDEYYDGEETHRCTVITLTGPWVEGARQHILDERDKQAERLKAAEARKEQEIIDQANEILARRAAEGKTSGSEN